MLERLMPKADAFFDLFNKQAEATVAGVRLLESLLLNFSDVEATVRAIKDVEHQGDAYTRQAFNRLHQQFITPFDRAEIHRLLSRIDDILDLADAAAERILLYEVGEIPGDAKALAGVLVAAALKVQVAVSGLRHVKKPAEILAACADINELENQGDALLRSGLAKLFKSGADPLTVIKWKEIYDLLETATDRCEDVADVIEGVVLEHA